MDDSLRIDFAPGQSLDETDAPVVDSYVIAEAHSVHYHAAECLMRLYMAHAGHGPCPWIDLAKLQSGSQFNSAVIEISDGTTDISAGVASVFTGNATNADADSLSAAERFLRLTAQHLHEERNLHNAVKHGFGIVPGRADLKFLSDSDGAEAFGVDGPSIVYLERSRSTRGTDWHESTQWFSLRRTILLTRMTITQLDALWTVARWRYQGTEPAGLELVTNEGIDMATTGIFADPHSRAKFRRSVGFEPVSGKRRKTRTPRS